MNQWDEQRYMLCCCSVYIYRSKDMSFKIRILLHLMPKFTLINYQFMCLHMTLSTFIRTVACRQVYKLRNAHMYITCRLSMHYYMQWVHHYKIVTRCIIKYWIIFTLYWLCYALQFTIVRSPVFSYIYLITNATTKHTLRNDDSVFIQVSELWPFS